MTETCRSSSPWASGFADWSAMKRDTSAAIVIATFVTVADFSLQALAPAIHEELGAFIAPKGAAMSFLIAGILSVAFMGFAGLFSAA